MVELALALARFTGLRIPSEIKHMRYTDFKEITFMIHEETKTGSREVPLLCEIAQVLAELEKKGYDLKSEELVFQNTKSISYRIRRAILAAGLTPWPKQFINLRSSCITDMVELDYTEKTLDAMFGNSHRTRQRYYTQFIQEKEYAKVLADNARAQEKSSTAELAADPQKESATANAELTDAVQKEEIAGQNLAILPLLIFLVSQFGTANSGLKTSQ